MYHEKHISNNGITCCYTSSSKLLGLFLKYIDWCTYLGRKGENNGQSFADHSIQ